MTPRATWSPHPSRKRTLPVAGWTALLALLLATSPAAADLTAIATVPESPTTCDSVTLVVAGATPTPCYEIVRADLEGPVPLETMGPIPAYEIRVRLVVRPTALPDSGACPTVIQPYRQTFDLSRLQFGSYLVKAVEVTLAAGSNAPADSSTLSSSFQVTPTEGCPPPDACYLLDFQVPLDGPRRGSCSGSASPGQTACMEVTLVNGLPVQGVQTVLEVLPGTRGQADPRGIHPLSVETAGRAAGLLLQWTADGPKTRIVLVSTGDPIPAGRGSILRICYSIGADVPPDVYPLRYGETIVADPEGEAMPPCPTFAEVLGRLCVRSAACDVNGDGRGNILDVVQIMKCALARNDSTAACPDSVAARADCNADGSIDVRDVICCVRKVLETEFGLPDGSVPSGDPTRIGFAGPVQWITPLAGRAEVTVEPGADFAGIDFAVEAAASGARIIGMRLVSGGGYRLESSVAEDGISVRGMLLAIEDGSGTAMGRATLAIDLAPSLPSGGGGVLTLAGAESANRDALAMPTDIPFASAAIPELATPVTPTVMAARPNPFRGETEIAYALPAATRATLRVYGASGRLVRTLVDSEMPAGVHRAYWDGTDSAGRTVGSGIYFFRFTAAEVTKTQRLMLLR